MQTISVFRINFVLLSQEFQEDNRNLVISEPETSQTVYIYKCNKSTIQVKGKINSMVVG